MKRTRPEIEAMETMLLGSGGGGGSGYSYGTDGSGDANAALAELDQGLRKVFYFFQQQPFFSSTGMVFLQLFLLNSM